MCGGEGRLVLFFLSNQPVGVVRSSQLPFSFIIFLSFFLSLAFSVSLSALVFPRWPLLGRPSTRTPSPNTVARGLGRRYRGPRGCRGRRQWAPAPPRRSSHAHPSPARTPAAAEKRQAIRGAPGGFRKPPVPPGSQQETPRR